MLTAIAAIFLGGLILQQKTEWPPLVLLTFLVASTISYQLMVRLPFAEITQGFAVSFVAIVVLGPVQAALVAGLGVSAGNAIFERKPLRRVLVNGSVQALSCLAAGYTYYLAGGFGGPNLNEGIAAFHRDPVFYTAKNFIPVILTGLVNSLINTALLLPPLMEKRIDPKSLRSIAFWDMIATVMFLPLVFIVFVVYGGSKLGNIVFTLAALLILWLILKKMMEVNIAKQALVLNLSQLKTIHEISKAINTSLDTKTILEIIAINGTPFLGVESAAVRIFDDPPHRGVYYDLAPSQKWAEFFRSSSFTQIIEHVKRFPERIVIPKLAIENIGRWYTPALAEQYGVQSFIGAPVLEGMRCIGAIIFLSRKPQNYTAGQLELMEFLANETAVAIKNARLYQEMHRTHERQQEEIRIAERVQLGSLPGRFEATDLVITGGIHPARELSGDFFDVLETKRDEVAVVIGDVSGKGIPASLTMMAILNSVKVLAPKVSLPSEMMALLNASLFDEAITMSDTLQYSTGFYGVINRRDMGMRYSIAGSERPLWWHAKQKVLTFLEGEGIPLGMFGDFKYRDWQIMMKPGDRIVMYTDGVTDAVNMEGERYSINRFLSSVERHCLRDVDDLAAALFEDVRTWTEGIPLADDVAIYVVHVNSLLQIDIPVETAAETNTGPDDRTLFD